MEQNINENAAKDMNLLIQHYHKAKHRHYLKKGALTALLMLLVGLGLCIYMIVRIDGKIPSTLYVRRDTGNELLLDVPATGEIVSVQSSPKSNIPKDSKSVTIDMSKKVTFVAAETATATQSQDPLLYTMKVRLFGWLPFKDVNIKFIDEEEVIPLGLPIGLYLKTDGLLVIGTGEFQNAKGESFSPAKGILYTGDYILKVNDISVTKKQQLLDAVYESHGSPLKLLVENEDGCRYETIQPKLDQSGEYKLGIWVKDSAQGIGTLTYVDKNGSFGALGHGISDVDTGDLIDSVDGTVYKTNIVRIKKGQKGTPGELTGKIIYSDENILADISANTQRGIYGTLRSNDSSGISGIRPNTLFDKIVNNSQLTYEPVKIALKQEIKKGRAYILSAFSGKSKLYEIEITNVYMDNDNINRGIVLKVTDKELLEETGGIVQGMSGSPILQDGRIIGAVTHVFVDNPKKGYGIFIENMLEP